MRNTENFKAISKSARFRQADLERALRASKRAGLAVAYYEISTEGSIKVVAGNASGTSPATEATPLAVWKAGRDARAT